MRKCFWLFLLVFLFILSAKAMPARADTVVNTSPSVNAINVSPGSTQITITFDEPIQIIAYPDTYGHYISASGYYDIGFFIASPSNTTVSSDKKTLILNTVLPEDDTITVTLNGGIAAYGNTADIFPYYTFSFTTQAVTAITPFDDPVLEQAVKHALEAACTAKYNLWNFQFPSDREIYQHEDPNVVVQALYAPTDQPIYVPIPAMDDLTTLQYPYEADQYFGTMIKSISGLVYANNLTQLTLHNNNISDLTPLQGLTKLQTLDLDMNDLTDNGLVTADLSPLGSLTQLQELHLNSCNISDVSGLLGIGSSLTYLDLSNNNISDIRSLSSLTGLQTLYLSTNQITNITPLIDLTSLTYLDLSNNQISDISPLNNQKLANLTYLNLDNNQISDGAPTGSLTALTDLELDSNKLSSIGFLSTLTNLQILHLSTNNIVDITPLQYLTDLQDLDLSDNSIDDISPLQGLTNLGTYIPSEYKNGTLNLSDNCLTDDCFQILEENGLWKIADINGKQKFDLLAYESYVKSFLNNASANMTILKPSGTTPTNETPLAVGDETKPLELDYNFSNVNMPNFDDLQQFEQYLSPIKVYVNGVYDEELTSSLSFDTEGSTLNPDSELTLILDHTIPFPDASTITVDVPQLLLLNGGRSISE